MSEGRAALRLRLRSAYLLAKANDVGADGVPREELSTVRNATDFYYDGVRDGMGAACWHGSDEPTACFGCAESGGNGRLRWTLAMRLWRLSGWVRLVARKVAR